MEKIMIIDWNNKVIAEMMGFFAIILGFVASYSKGDKSLKRFSLVGSVLWCFHFFLLQLMTEFFAVLLVGIRLLFIEIVINKSSNKDKYIFFVMFSGLHVLFMVLTWRDYVSIISTVSCVVATYAFFFEVGVRLRGKLLLADTGWFWVGFLTISYSMMIQSFINIVLKVMSIHKIKKSQYIDI